MIFICVIIYKPIGKTIPYNELKDSWSLNSDGGGFIVRNPTTTKVLFKKGFMEFEQFYKEIEQYNIKQLQLVVHLRITSIGTTSKRQTHPFKCGNPNILQSKDITDSVYCMNGTIISQDIIDDMNDTYSFITQYLTDITATQGIINLISDATDALWIAVNNKGIFYSESFIEYGGNYYSNLNHLYYSTTTSDKIYWYDTPLLDDKEVYPFISKKLYNKCDIYTKYDITEFIDTICLNSNKHDCKKCIKDCKTISQIDDFLDKRYNELYLFDYKE